jgi:hypothetical protein
VRVKRDEMSSRKKDGRPSHSPVSASRNRKNSASQFATPASRNDAFPSSSNSYSPVGRPRVSFSALHSSKSRVCVGRGGRSSSSAEVTSSLRASRTSALSAATEVLGATVVRTVSLWVLMRIW